MLHNSLRNFLRQSDPNRENSRQLAILLLTNDRLKLS